MLEVEAHKPAGTEEEKIVAFVINRIEAFKSDNKDNASSSSSTSEEPIKVSCFVVVCETYACMFKPLLLLLLLMLLVLGL